MVLVSDTLPPLLPKVSTEVFLAREIYNTGFLYVNSELCPNNGNDLKFFMFVVSAPDHQARRMAIRQTWGSYGQRRDISVAFLFGVTDDPTKQNLLAEENALYGDLIMGRNHDHVENLTLKAINILEWANKYCSNAKFVFKTDDDVFVNVKNLLEVVEEHKNAERSIIGHLAHNWYPQRNSGKYDVSMAVYPNSTWPDFITGPSVLISRDIIADLFESTLKQVYIKLDDVYLTGLSIRSLNIKLVNNERFFDVRRKFENCDISGKIVNLHAITPDNQYVLWDTMQTGKKDGCLLRYPKADQTGANFKIIW